MLLANIQEEERQLQEAPNCRREDWMNEWPAGLWLLEQSENREKERRPADVRSFCFPRREITREPFRPLLLQSEIAINLDRRWPFPTRARPSGQITYRSVLFYSYWPRRCNTYKSRLTLSLRKYEKKFLVLSLSLWYLWISVLKELRLYAVLKLQKSDVRDYYWLYLVKKW